MSIASLRSTYAVCTLCPELVANRSQVVFGEGDTSCCKIVIIGEGPGATEDKVGKPFVGRSGTLLTELLRGIGVAREEVFITNTVLCRPPNNRNPKPSELHNCRSRLDETIKALNPKVVVTLGNFATKYMLQTREGITALRGKPVKKQGRIIFPMFHPAVLVYNGNKGPKRELMESDFQVLKSLL